MDSEQQKELEYQREGDRSYWHVPITTLDGGKLAINLSKVGSKAELEPYRFEFKKAARK
jgi:hypothetical protein